MRVTVAQAEPKRHRLEGSAPHPTAGKDVNRYGVGPGGRPLWVSHQLADSVWAGTGGFVSARREDDQRSAHILLKANGWWDREPGRPGQASVALGTGSRAGRALGFCPSDCAGWGVKGEGQGGLLLPEQQGCGGGAGPSAATAREAIPGS